MQFFPAALQNLADQFARLPGIGGKTAQRLAFHVLSLDLEDAQEFAEAILDAKRTVKHCPCCQNLTDREICPICDDDTRDHSLICVVADSSMADLEAQVSSDTVLNMSIKGDEAGIREVLGTIKGVSGVVVLPAPNKKTVTLKVTTEGQADLRDDIFFAMAERRYAVISMERSEHSLEEIFLSLTAKGKNSKEVQD